MTSLGASFYSGFVEDEAMLLAFNRPLNPAAAVPETAARETESRLNITVIFTSVDATVAALQKAGTLAESLSARITLIVPQIVPYPLPLTSPPVLLDFQENRFRQIASESPVDITVQLYLCRDGIETVKKVLQPHSLIVVGGKKRMWPTFSKKLAGKLRRAGHEVIFAEDR
jgi:hypothetical protein